MRHLIERLNDLLYCAWSSRSRSVSGPRCRWGRNRGLHRQAISVPQRPYSQRRWTATLRCRPHSRADFRAIGNRRDAYVLKGSAGTAPQNLSIAQQTLYFTGIDQLASWPRTQAAHRGCQCANSDCQGSPSGCARRCGCQSGGTIYVSDRSASGNGLALSSRLSGPPSLPCSARSFRESRWYRSLAG